MEAETAHGAIAEQARKEALQVELIKRFVEHPNPANARANLLFLAQSGLRPPDHGDKIQAFLIANPQHALHGAERPRIQVAREPGLKRLAWMCAAGHARANLAAGNTVAGADEAWADSCG